MRRSRLSRVSRLKKRVHDDFPRSKYPDRLLLAKAKRKARAYFDKYGEFEAYNSLSTDLPEKVLTTGGEIDYNKIFKIWVDTYYHNPDMPV